jgi:SnoaL-like domain
VSALADRPTKLPLRAAMEARDLGAVVDAFAPDAIVRSPLTGRLTFQGREQIRPVMEVILEVFDDLRYTDELHGGDSAVLVASARVAGTDIEMVDHVRLDESGKIRELTVFFRPMPAIAVAMRLIGTGLGRRKSRVRAQAISLLTRPLGLMTRLGDRMAVRLVGPAA